MRSWTRIDSEETFEVTATLDEADDGRAREALVEFWGRLAEEVARAYPDGGWDVLIAYLRPETDEVIAHPATLEAPESAGEPMRVSLRRRAWGRACHDLPNPDDFGPRYTAGYRRLLKAIAKSLNEAIDDPAVLPTFRAWRRDGRFAVYTCEPVEVVHRANLAFLWKNRPPKGIPAGSAAEMFAWFMHKAQIDPDDCLRFEGDRLHSATYFGGEFSIKTVGSMETVPDIGPLRAGLAEIKLEWTRVDEAGVGRLRRLLPTVPCA